MRQIAPKKVKQPVPQTPPEKPKRRASRAPTYISPFKQPSGVVPPTTPTTFNSKRLRTKAARATDPPGAKRARAMASVKGYVERHYTALGIAWPPERPTRDDSNGQDDVEHDATRYRRRPDKKRHGYHDNGVVGGGGYSRPSSCSLSSISHAAAILAGAHGNEHYSHGRSNGVYRPPQEGSKYGSVEAGSALSLLAEVIAGGQQQPLPSVGQGSSRAGAGGGGGVANSGDARVTVPSPNRTPIASSPWRTPRLPGFRSGEDTPEHRHHRSDGRNDTARHFGSSPASQWHRKEGGSHIEKMDRDRYHSQGGAIVGASPSPAPVATASAQVYQAARKQPGREGSDVPTAQGVPRSATLGVSPSYSVSDSAGAMSGASVGVTEKRNTAVVAAAAATAATTASSGVRKSLGSKADVLLAASDALSVASSGNSEPSVNDSSGAVSGRPAAETTEGNAAAAARDAYSGATASAATALLSACDRPGPKVDVLLAATIAPTTAVTVSPAPVASDGVGAGSGVCAAATVEWDAAPAHCDAAAAPGGVGDSLRPTRDATLTPAVADRASADARDGGSGVSMLGPLVEGVAAVLAAASREQGDVTPAAAAVSATALSGVSGSVEEVDVPAAAKIADASPPRGMNDDGVVAESNVPVEVPLAPNIDTAATPPHPGGGVSGVPEDEANVPAAAAVAESAQPTPGASLSPEASANVQITPTTADKASAPRGISENLGTEPKSPTAVTIQRGNSATSLPEGLTGFLRGGTTDCGVGGETGDPIPTSPRRALAVHLEEGAAIPGGGASFARPGSDLERASDSVGTNQWHCSVAQRVVTNAEVVGNTEVLSSPSIEGGESQQA